MNAVLLADEEQLRLADLGKALAAFKKVPFQDAAHEARQCWGIMAENVSQTDADRLIDLLGENKIHAFSVPMEKMPALPAPAVLSQLDIHDGKISGRDVSGTTHEVGAHRLAVVAASAIKITSLRIVKEEQGPTAAQKLLKMGIMLATMVPIQIGPKKQTVEKKVSETDLALVLDLVALDPLRSYRLLADHVNYNFLKERMLYNVMGNFKLFLADLVKSASSARRGKGTRILLANQPVSAMGYETLADVEKECRWLTALSFRE